MSKDAELVLAELKRMYDHAGGDPTRRANPTIDVRSSDLSTRIGLDLAKTEATLQELAAATCVTRHGEGNYTLTPVGVLRSLSV